MSNVKLCACGSTAWFGNYCHGCRDAALKRVCVDGRNYSANRVDGAAPNGHAAMRTPMSPTTLATMDRMNSKHEPQDGDEGD